MRIRVSHRTSYTYDPPARSVIQNLRLTPRSHQGQYVMRWRVFSDADCSTRQGEDSAGNILHTLSHRGPVAAVELTAEGEVETSNTIGVIRGGVELLPPDIFLRDSVRAIADEALRDFAAQAVRGAKATLEQAHQLMDAIHAAMVFDPKPTVSQTSAASAFALRRGVCQDYTHIFIACARWLGLPARYISGYLAAPDGAANDAGHAWAEVYVADLGWVAFDAVNATCADEYYVRVAAGFDAIGAAPVRGAQYGGGEERLKVALKISQSSSQSQE